ncbi:putative DNA-binding protein [Bacillus sp. TS-2]|nr:putative DNA-binding protein [Bacillus sp. TS-2]
MKNFIKADVYNPIDFISAGQLMTTERWKHMKRKHEDIYVAIINLNDVVYIEQNDYKYEIKPGEVFFLLPNQLHQGYQFSNIGTSYYWIHFCFRSLVSMKTKRDIHKEIIQKNNSKKNSLSFAEYSTIYLPVHSRPLQIERIHILTKQILDLTKSHQFNQRSLHFLATALLIEISEQTIQHFIKPVMKSRAETKMEPIMEWIHIHQMYPITVSQIAEHFNYNSDYLSRIFKNCTGMNLQEYIHKLKIEKAKELLIRTNESIKVISYAVGINDEKYFMKLFKKHEKVTPSEFRAAYFRLLMNNN